MKKFIVTILLFFIPFEIILLTYVISDPFMVLRKYDAFFEVKSKAGVGLNKDYVSTTTFDHNYIKEQYNSFIFGNSRSVFYQISDWKKYLKGKNNCYHFDASGETLYALHKKVKYVDRKKLSIKNVLLILDYATLVQDMPKTSHMTIISPQLENYKNLIAFHTSFFKAFMSFNFMYAYFDFKISGKVKPYMKTGDLIGDTPCENDLITNEVRFPLYEEFISNGTYYTEEKKKIFFKRDSIQNFSPKAIVENQKTMLTEICHIFKKNETNYKIIINPLYDQIKLNSLDLDYLNQLFGKENVFDFSGINKFTNDYTNYYETSHYRPHIANEIMDSIYRTKAGV